jgi:hypothetical protein
LGEEPKNFSVKDRAWYVLLLAIVVPFTTIGTSNTFGWTRVLTWGFSSALLVAGAIFLEKNRLIRVHPLTGVF